MSNCCLSGKVHQGQPAGREDEIGGLSTYISEPENHSKAKSIIFITDSAFAPCAAHLPPIILSLALLIHPIPSIRVQIPQHPPPRRRIRQSGVLHIRARRARRRLAANFLFAKRRASTQDARDAQRRGQGQECRHRACDFGSVARQTPGGCLGALDRRLRQYGAHDTRHEQDWRNRVLLGRAVCGFAGPRAEKERTG